MSARARRRAAGEGGGVRLLETPRFGLEALGGDVPVAGALFADVELDAVRALVGAQLGA